MVTDVHAHAIPPQVVDALPHPVRLRQPLLDVPARLRAMDEAGIDLQLVASWIGIVAYDLRPEQGRRWARLFNDALAEVVAAHPDRLRGLGMVPLQDPDGAVKELQRLVSAGMAGVEIATTVNGAELDDPALEPFWAAAAELRCLVLLHPDLSLPGRPSPRYFLNNLVGNGAETTIAVAHLLFAGVLERHPDLRLVLVHGGGHLPYLAGRLDHGFAVAPQQTGTSTTQRPSEQLKRLHFDTVTHSHDVLRFLIHFAGPEHVVLGSDYPFEMGQPDPVGFVRSLPGLGPADQESILEGNARRLLEGIRCSSSA
jgi:aminocarboxymuconate-semialdehyde decarboxylase